MRAELRTGNLLTGQKYVDMDPHPDAPAEQVWWKADPAIFPTVSNGIDEIQDSMASIAKKLQKVPFDQLSYRLMSTLSTLDTTLKDTDTLMHHVRQRHRAAGGVAPSRKRKEAMQNAKELLGKDAPLQSDLGAALLQLSRAAKSISDAGRLSGAPPRITAARQAGRIAMKSLLLSCVLAAAAAGCASTHPDHFYVLSAVPGAAPAVRAPPTFQAALKVSLPAVVDRAEFVLTTSAEGVTVLEHERWAAPLLDLVTQTLARDIERRRTDVLVAVPGSARPAGRPRSMSPWTSCTSPCAAGRTRLSRRTGASSTSRPTKRRWARRLSPRL